MKRQRNLAQKALRSTSKKSGAHKDKREKRVRRRMSPRDLTEEGDLE